MKAAVIIIGPPGSGKGTQAELLAKKLSFFNFDTGQYLRSVLHDPKFKNNKTIQKERKLNDAGTLNTPFWVLDIVKKRVNEIAALGQGVVFSGSPRTFYEAFGYEQGKKPNKVMEGLLAVLNREYGRKNVYIFNFTLSAEGSIKRNSARSSCLVCGNPFMAGEIKSGSCPFCGGKIIKRKDDKKEVILHRLNQYKERTMPILDEMKKQGFKIFKIDASPLPYKIHQVILAKFKNR